MRIAFLTPARFFAFITRSALAGAISHSLSDQLSLSIGQIRSISCNLAGNTSLAQSSTEQAATLLRSCL